jgi:anaerobic magnesium-protoporphyrin IX monomethyl ester cyclase
MKIVFVYPTYENLGIEYLSAVLKQEGHQTELVLDPCLFDDSHHYNPFFKKILSFRKYIVNRIIKSQADLVCFSAVSDYYSWACEIAEEVRKRTEVPIVFGGTHPTSVPEQVISNDFIDYVVVGEGEGAIVDLARRLEQKDDDYRIKNVWFKRRGQIIRNELRDLIQDLDSLPFPDKDLYSREFTDFKGQYTIITSRGCPFSCTYCCNNFLRGLYQGKGRYHRCRSVENVIAELKLAKEKDKIKSVYFFDEELLFDFERAKRLLQFYKKEINLPFWCYTDPRILDEERIDLLEESGCCETEIGIQELDHNLNKNILKRNIDTEHLKTIIKKAQKVRIRLWADIILGLPTQKEKNLIDMVNFFNENRISVPQIFWIRYYPKTEMVNIAMKEGILQDKECNEPDSCGAFYVRGSAYNPRFAKIGNLFYLCCLLPKWLVRLMVKKRVYEYFPPALFKAFFSNIIDAKIFIMWYFGLGKQRIYFGKRRLYYLHYFWKWLTTP